MEYALVRDLSSKKLLIVAEDRIGALELIFETTFESLSTFNGKLYNLSTRFE